MVQVSNQDLPPPAGAPNCWLACPLSVPRNCVALPSCLATDTKMSARQGPSIWTSLGIAFWWSRVSSRAKRLFRTSRAKPIGDCTISGQESFAQLDPQTHPAWDGLLILMRKPAPGIDQKMHRGRAQNRNPTTPANGDVLRACCVSKRATIRGSKRQSRRS